MKRIFATFLFLLTLHITAQPLPQGYFRLPLDGDIALSASFAEFRMGHFHAGLDIRTGGEVGKPVYAVADGYVCGVRISSWGGGKMLYVKHPNGYTSVYMHLDGYAGEIGRWVRGEQYKDESYTLVRDIPEGVLPVKKGQVIAYSGNTGGSGGPHLHFELRRDGHTINPLLFGLRYIDNINPIIRGVRIYPVGGEPVDVGMADKIAVASPFYLGVYATDAAEGSTLRNGVDRVEVFVDGTLFFKYVTEGFALDSSRMSNALIDYPHYVRTRQAYLLTRSLPGAQGEWIPVCQDDGILRFAEGTTHSIRIRVADIKGNSAERMLYVTSQGSVTMPSVADEGKNTYPIFCMNPLKINGKELRLVFPAHTVYADDRLHIVTSSSSLYRSPICTVKPCTSELPPHEWYTLSLKATSPVEKGVIVMLDGKRPTAYKTSREDDWYTAQVRDFGRFALTVDEEPPSVSPINFKGGRRLKGNVMRLKISDNLSGIDTYKCYLNGKWILAEYDGKSASLTINAAGVLRAGKNELRVEVSDIVGNLTRRTFTLTR